VRARGVCDPSALPSLGRCATCRATREDLKSGRDREREGGNDCGDKSQRNDEVVRARANAHTEKRGKERY